MANLEADAINPVTLTTEIVFGGVVSEGNDSVSSEKMVFIVDAWKIPLESTQIHQDIDASYGRGINGGRGVVGEGGDAGPGVVGIAGGTISKNFDKALGRPPSEGPGPGRGIRTGVFGTGRAHNVEGETAGRGGAIGVLGDSDSGVGVSGISDQGTGVVGTGRTGVEGFGSLDGGPGVFGRGSGESSVGVVGFANTGVHGEGLSVGVAGKGITGITGASSVSGGVGVFGRDGGGGAGVGIFGFSEGPDGVAVHGFYNDEAQNFGIGVVAEVDNARALALYAVNNADGRDEPSPRAAMFVGDVEVLGSFTVFGGPKSAAVPHPDGAHRLLYCVESPESWFEDFGEANLVDGRANVRIDADFAIVADTTSHYHIFLTPYGDSQGLYVSARDEGEFEVREQGGGSASLSFSYRVVAKRRDGTTERFKKVKLPLKHKVPARKMG